MYIHIFNNEITHSVATSQKTHDSWEDATVMMKINGKINLVNLVYALNN